MLDRALVLGVGDMFELQSNKLAEERGNAAEKSFATMMIKDHTKTSDELKSLVKSGDVKAELPTALDSSHQSKLDKLSGYKGADFSSEFNSQQVSAHEDAVPLFGRYAKGGDNSKLKDKDKAGLRKPFLRCSTTWTWRKAARSEGYSDHLVQVRVFPATADGASSKSVIESLIFPDRVAPPL